MVTKKRLGSERVKPDSRGYLAIERACQGVFSSHPEGMALPGLRFVEALDRGFSPALHTSPSAASGRSHVTALLGVDRDPGGAEHKKIGPHESCGPVVRASARKGGKRAEEGHDDANRWIMVKARLTGLKIYGRQSPIRRA
jgi:hypothetical protein